MAESQGVLLSPTFPPASIGPGMMTGGGGFDRIRKVMVRKTVDYHCSVLRYLENRVWQRDNRDIPVIQPDSSYFNEVVVPQGCQDSPVNAVTTKFVKACTNKARSPIFCTTWVPDGRRLVTGAASGEFTLWNGISFNFESIIQAHDCSVRSMNWSHNGKWMVTTDDRGFVKYWQINFNNVHTFQAHSEPVRSSSFAPTDSKLATCSDDGTVRIFDFLSCTEEHLLRGHGADVKCIHWHPTKSLLASGSKDNQQPVKLWDPKAGQSVCTIHAHKATVMDVKWNQNGNWLGTASRDHLIKVYDIRMMKELWVLKGHKKDVNTLSWHPIHETLFASGGSDGAILFWTIGNSREIGGMESAHEGFVWSLSWHPLGHLLCSGANDHTCKFWCRNRPGEEIKDKYNTFHNPFFGGEELETMPYQLPGMGVGLTHGSVSLPPPPPHINNGITHPPPPMGNIWKPPPENSIMDGNLDSPQINVPVLGADIIAQTFADRKASEPDEFGKGTFNQPGGISENQSNSFQPSMNEFEDQKPKPLPHGPFDGHLSPPVSGPQFRGPPLEDRQGFGNRFSWHNPEMNPRHPPFEEERWPNQAGNPYVYRRPDGPPNTFGDNRRPPIMEERRRDEWKPPRRHGEDFHSPGFHENRFGHQSDFHRDKPESGSQSSWQPPQHSPLFLSNQRDWPSPHGDPIHKPENSQPSESKQSSDPRGHQKPGQEPHHFDQRRPPNGQQSSGSHDSRGPSLGSDRGGSAQRPGDDLRMGLHVPSHDSRGPHKQSQGPPPLPPHGSRDMPLHEFHGPAPHDFRGPPPSHDPHNPRGPPPLHLRGPPPPHDFRGPPDPHGPPPHDHQGPPPSHDIRGPPPSHNPRGPPQSHDPQGPPSSHDPRGPPPSHDPRGLPPSHDPRGPPNPRAPLPSHDPRGPPPSHDPRGPPSSHDPRGPPNPRGPPLSHDSRDPPPSHDPRGRHLSHDPRGPHPPHHDGRGATHDSRGPMSHNFEGHPHDMHELNSHDPRGPPPSSYDLQHVHDRRGPPHNQRGPPPHGPPPDSRGGSYNQRGPPPPHDNQEPIGGDFRKFPQDKDRPMHHSHEKGHKPIHDMRGGPPPPEQRGPPPISPSGPQPPFHPHPSHLPPNEHFPPQPPERPFHGKQNFNQFQGPPSDPRMSQQQHPPQPQGGDSRFKQHMPSPQQGFQGSPGNDYSSDGFGSHTSGYSEPRDPRFERRGDGWHGSHRGGRDDRGRKDTVSHVDERRGSGHGRGRGLRDDSPNRRGSTDERDGPPAKRPRN